MVKKILFLLITVLTLISCKQQNDENKSLDVKKENSSNSKYLSKKEKDTGSTMQVEKTEKLSELLFKCKENDNGISRYDDPLNKTCVCNDSTFNSAYKIFYDESPDYIQDNLLKKLPQKNSVWKAADAEVTYSWILQDTLKINMFFQGGENNYIFYKNSDNKMEYKEYLSLP
ncbi:hypothetical protein IRZ71_05695 [Flavobacterium sp. ANB]|uniref:hypothetical protein n=1 Tax=unclassified Flavobacterium TaxID=196869 RepID=UPI0012B9BCB0|nr:MULTISPECIES: hypothetical protein [unclassified Flavobacterium]MBF4515824.1 hypothetical protein [Flavobacterium sp. ANB]MTD68827.1 hypothetical protein [Flavobacterium sp. LC2016-13]